MRRLTASASRGFAIGMARPVAVWPAVWERRFMPNEQSLDEKSEGRQRRGLKESGKHVESPNETIHPAERVKQTMEDPSYRSASVR